MYGVVPSLDFPKSMMQKCPLCGTNQVMFIAGTVRHPEKFSEAHPVADRGYSFCNCRNIFFTDWKNIDQTVYDNHYSLRYDAEHTKKVMDRHYDKLFVGDCKVNKGARVLEIGASSTFILDRAKADGAETVGCDYDSSINPNGHDYIFGDIESQFVRSQLFVRAPFDIIFMSHVIEHLKDPIDMIQRLNQLMFKCGKLIITMPDPFFIDWSNVYMWQHWHLREHHIMWDMDSFCEMMEENGFKTIRTIRNTLYQGGDCTMVFEKI